MSAVRSRGLHAVLKKLIWRHLPSSRTFKETVLNVLVVYPKSFLVIGLRPLKLWSGKGGGGGGGEGGEGMIN